MPCALLVFFEQFASQIPATNYNTDPDTRGGGTFEGTVSDVPRFVAWARVTASPSVSKPYALLHKKIPAGVACSSCMYSCTSWQPKSASAFNKHGICFKDAFCILLITCR